MEEKLHEIAEKRFGTNFDQLGEREKHVARHIAGRTPISRNVSHELSEKLTFGQRLADTVASFGGSWTFIIIFAAVLAAWVILNTFILISYGSTFDPYPYILLNLFLSMLASIQAPIIMMSQNRQNFKDRENAEHDYEVNLKAELEILALHEKIDALRETQWSALITLQQEQLRILGKIAESLQAGK